jgi:hypothetical protein
MQSLGGALPCASVRLVLHLLKHPDETRPYMVLKEKLLSSHEPTNFERIEKLFQLEPLGGGSRGTGQGVGQTIHREKESADKCGDYSLIEQIKTSQACTSCITVINFLLVEVSGLRGPTPIYIEPAHMSGDLRKLPQI